MLGSIDNGRQGNVGPSADKKQEESFENAEDAAVAARGVIIMPAKDIHPDFQRERLSPHFVYESYDAESGLFFNRDSVDLS